MTSPRATIRLQFHHGFTLDDAVTLVDYYADLGISHIYASPLTRARAGSTHGYDTVDYGVINPELGGEDALRRLVVALRRRGMGIILDIVPNHMGIGAENAWWMDVLQSGRTSSFAGYFDIDWEPPDPTLRGRVLLPLLAAQYGEVLNAGELVLAFDDRTRSFIVRYHDQHFPISLRDQEELRHRAEEAGTDRVLAAHASESAAGRLRLHALLERQHYRLAWWRTAADTINWRRFFDITELAGIAVERPEVFEAVHTLVFRLYAEGLIDGVRIDHVDGLADPRGYCRKLRRRLASLAAARPAEALSGPAYIIVEKILGTGEHFARDWLVDGTTGYDFMNEMAAVLHDPTGETPLGRLWTEVGGAADFNDEACAARREILTETFASELEAAARGLECVARMDLATRDITRAALRRLLVELVAHFPVYRTYVRPASRSTADAAIFARALAGARRTARPGEALLLDFLDAWLGGTPLRRVPPGPARSLRRGALTRFQQLTGPVAAKAVEDTAGYRYGRLLSRNEVGADASQFALTVSGFHATCTERAVHFPHTLLATATHDHKRGEDVRARLAVLSELAREWASAVLRWRERNAPLRSSLECGPAPDAMDEAMLYQMIVAAWPPALATDDAAGCAELIERLAAWQRKALREAKRYSRWTAPNAAYEEACEAFLRGLLQVDSSGSFREEVVRFAYGLGPAGAVNGLAQTILRLTTPGVPDLYQGTEFWDMSLVDPDNRAPVDHGPRIAALDELVNPAELLPTWRDGRVKQAVIARILSFRAAYSTLFAEGGYEPLKIEGPLAEHVIAFARHQRDEVAIAVATRLAARLVESDLPLVPPTRWEGTMICVPTDGTLDNAVSGTKVTAHNGRLAVSDALPQLPGALLGLKQGGKLGAMSANGHRDRLKLGGAIGFRSL